MKESEATPGTKLKALLIAQQTGITLRTSLSYMTEQASYDWNKTMQRLQSNLVEEVRRARGLTPKGSCGKIEAQEERT